MIIIGITGTLGSGKGTVVDYLVTKKGFKHFSVREFIGKEITKKDLPITRDNLVLMGNELRKKYGPSYIAKTLYERAKKSGKNTIIESLRNPYEVTTLRKMGTFYLFALDANPKVRFQRVLKRASETDKITFQEFINHEEREMSSKDPTKQNLKKVISMADFKFKNDGSLKELYDQIEKALKSIIS